MSKDKNKPEWVPKDGGKEFTSNVMQGITPEEEEDIRKKFRRKFSGRSKMSAGEMKEGILKGDLVALSRAITLVESNTDKHIEKAQQLLKDLLPNTGNSVRIGITGSPGAGKSTFIESFGTYLCENGLKTAVLAVDPSSSLSRGSVLGDKTRMERLSKHKNSFIRPSPSGGTLGGVTRKTRETILLCEAAGYEVILIETIGVGQSEITVRSMVDFFMLMLIPGAGDELQGIKKGVVEIADALIVNKAEGDNKQKANVTKRSYENALQLLMPATEGWTTKVRTCSALHEKGIDDIWTLINDFIINVKNSGIFEKRRKEQTIKWMYTMLEETILNKFYSHPDIKDKIKQFENEVIDERSTPTQAVNRLTELIEIK